MKITYHADINNLGDNVAKEDAQGFRDWVQAEIEKAYPDADVSVKKYDGRDEISGFDSEENPNGDDEVKEFLNTLWDKCPWSWVTLND